MAGFFYAQNQSQIALFKSYGQFNRENPFALARGFFSGHAYNVSSSGFRQIIVSRTMYAPQNKFYSFRS